MIALAVYKLGQKSATTKLTQAIFTASKMPHLALKIYSDAILIAIATILSLLIEKAWALPIYLLGSGLVSYGVLTLLEDHSASSPIPRDSKTEGDKNADEEILELKGNTDDDHSNSRDYQTFGTLEETDLKKGDRFSTTTIYTSVGFILSAFIILIALFLLHIAYPQSKILLLAELFYRIGALIYGGGQVSKSFQISLALSNESLVFFFPCRSYCR